MKLTVGLHTVLILVGPSQSGKSTWSSIFSNKVKEIDPAFRCKIISSDEIRREILGEEYHRYDQRMTAVSAQAFDLIKSKLAAYTKYPSNNEFIIIDTTGMDSQFRADISEMAREQAYRVGVVLFDYPTSDYFKDVSPGRDREIVSRHVDTFKKKVLQTISRKNFDYCFSIKGKEPKFFEGMELTIDQYDLWKSCQLDPTKEVAFIGDIHEHVEALKEMQRRLPEGIQLVLLGDYVDKGGKTKEVIPVVEDMVAKGAKVLVGNHEAYVARRLRKEITASGNEDKVFTSFKAFESDPELAARFLKIYDQSIPFAFYSNENISLYATHAPCKNKYLGKMSDFALKSQRNFFFKSREMADMAEELTFVREEVKNSHPIHVFGHVAHQFKRLDDKNKVWLDTGAVYGNKLSSFIVKPDGETRIIHIPCAALSPGEFFYFAKKEKVEDTVVEAELPEKKSSKFEKKLTKVEQLAEKYNLTEKDVFWLNDFIKSGASFIAGTMSPAKSTETELEPLSQAIAYYQGKGVTSVVLQPKFMGSRVQFYLHADSGKDFLITRSGHKSKLNKETKELLNYWSQKTKEVYGWKESIILDGELMPWSAIGQDLINRDFIPYGKSHYIENEVLLNDPVFNSFEKFNKYDAKWRLEHIEIFLKQIELYGSVGDTYYCPFNILKMDDLVYPYSSSEVFAKLNNYEDGKNFLIVDLTKDDALVEAQLFFEKLTKGEYPYEGIVVKPINDKDLGDYAPYMKVRNENYLHIIYGYDYQKSYQKMCSQKRIGKKLVLSIKEYFLGKKMLSASKDQLAEIACEMLFEIKQEQELDTRL